MRMVYGVAAGAEILLLVICALRAPKRKSDLAKIVCLYEWAVVFCGLSYYTFLYAGQAEQMKQLHESFAKTVCARIQDDHFATLKELICEKGNDDFTRNSIEK